MTMTPVGDEMSGSGPMDRDVRRLWSNNPSRQSSNLSGRAEDSWIEVSSRPTSSLPANVADHNPNERSSPPLPTPLTLPPRSTSAAGSSQDEYEESSSESDQVMSSSNEDVQQEGDDDDRTALGIRPVDTVFTPQPNAFSHPPSVHRPDQTSYFPRPTSTPSSFTRPRPHLTRERTSGSYQPDHDAALRASLTTLLSCAAAVRPKAEKAPERAVARRMSVQPTALRLVSERDLQAAQPVPVKRTKRPSRSRSSSKERAAKKAKADMKSQSIDDQLSSSLASWIISAGVIVVFSAISFSAGYYMGKIDGRIEGQYAMTGSDYGKAVMRGSRGHSWSNASQVVVA